MGLNLNPKGKGYKKIQIGEQRTEVHSGSYVAIMGVDKPQGLLKLSKGLHIASEEVVENVVKNGDPKALASLAVDMLKEMLED